MHRFLGILAGTFIAIHGARCCSTTSCRSRSASCLSRAPTRTGRSAVALGIVAAELLAALAVTNHYRKRLPHGLWRRLHMLNFAVWGLALVHGLTAGTDAFTTWALVLYAGSAWLVLALLVHRISLHWNPVAIDRKEHAMAIGRKVIAGAAAALAVGGAGAGVAATKLATSSPSEESKAIVNDAAKTLGVEPSKLSAALKKAYEDRIDAAVAAGRLTKQQGDELKQRIESEDFPLLGPPGFGHGPGGPHGFVHGLDAAATYLGLTEDELHSRLESGKTLAEIAKAQGKSVDGLKDAMVKDAKAHLDAAVKAGRLSASMEKQMLADLEQHIDDLVNGKLPDRHGFRGRGFDRHGPPPAAAFAGPSA